MSNNNWKAWSPDAAEREDTEQRQERNVLPYIKLKEGRNALRIMPPQGDSDSPFLRVWQHYINGDDGKLVVFECPWRGKPLKERTPCPACEAATRMDQSSNPLDREKARKLFPTMRVYANAIDRSDAMAGPKVLTIPGSVYEELLSIAKDSDAGGDFTNPDTGFDVVITKTGSGMETRYKTKAARDNSPLADDPADADEWLDSMHKLRDTIRVLSAEQIREAIDGLAPLPNASVRRLNSPDTGRSSARAPSNTAAPRGRASDEAFDADVE